MKLLYFDCASGISGDMTLGALVDLGVDLEKLNAAIGSLGLPDCRLVAAEVQKNGFRATQVTVRVPPEHQHRHLQQILEMIRGSRLTPRQKDLAGRIFTRLGEAEAKVHGVSVEKVHFHEVGAADSIADIVGTAVGLDLLGVERIVASPVPTGTGKVRIAHGECSIPAPATAELLRGIPLASSHVEAELTTPTGAAILAALADEFGPPPAMTIERIGCGAGHRDLVEQPNLLRCCWGGRPRRHRRPGVGRGNQSRRHQRRADRLLHHAALGSRRPGCLPDGDPDEKKPAGREDLRPVPGCRAWTRSRHPVPRDEHPGRAPLAGERHVLPRQAHTRRYRLGAGRGKGGLAARRSAAVFPRVRGLPPHCREQGVALKRFTKRPKRPLIPTRCTMTLIAEFAAAQWVFMAAVLLITWILLSKTHRYLKRTSRPVPTAEGFGRAEPQSPESRRSGPAGRGQPMGSANARVGPRAIGPAG